MGISFGIHLTSEPGKIYFSRLNQCEKNKDKRRFTEKRFRSSEDLYSICWDIKEFPPETPVVATLPLNQGTVTNIKLYSGSKIDPLVQAEEILIKKGFNMDSFAWDLKYYSDKKNNKCARVIMIAESILEKTIDNFKEYGVIPNAITLAQEAAYAFAKHKLKGEKIREGVVWNTEIDHKGLIIPIYHNNIMFLNDKSYYCSDFLDNEIDHVAAFETAAKEFENIVDPSKVFYLDKSGFDKLLKKVMNDLKSKQGIVYKNMGIKTDPYSYASAMLGFELGNFPNFLNYKRDKIEEKKKLNQAIMLFNLPPILEEKN